MDTELLGKIHQVDCIEFMKQLPDDCIDLVFADPPYNAKNIGPNSRIYEGQIMQLPENEYRKFCADWIAEVLRIGKTVVITPGIANVCFYPQPSWIVCWHKPAACSFNRFGGFNAWEPIMIWGKIAKGKRLPQDYILCNTMNFSKGAEKDHPCPKPVELMLQLVDKFCPEDGIVFDPFTGSGTTLLAAKKLGKKFFGTEHIKTYCDIAEERLRQDYMF